MNRTESTYSERVGARISPELKESLRELVEAGVFDSEADAVREALWQYVEQRAGDGLPQPAAAPEQPAQFAQSASESAPEPAREWLLSALFMLVAIVGSRILNALNPQPVTPAELADDAIQETIYNHGILRKKLHAARHIAAELESSDE